VGKERGKGKRGVKEVDLMDDAGRQRKKQKPIKK
jgi:hypothetical protein